MAYLKIDIEYLLNEMGCIREKYINPNTNKYEYNKNVGKWFTNNLSVIYRRNEYGIMIWKCSIFNNGRFEFLFEGEENDMKHYLLRKFLRKNRVIELLNQI